MSLGAVGNIFHIIRELNLNDIRQEAERRFGVLVAGDGAEALAEALSVAPGKEGIHPWLRAQGLPVAPREQGPWDVALLVVSQVELPADAADALRALDEARVPTLVVVADDEATRQIGADLPRPRETGRVVVAASATPDATRAAVGAALARVAPSPLKLALARQLPALRPMLVRELIEETSRANAVYAASSGLAEVVPVLNLPLNAADILLLTKNQLVMAYKIALAAGKQGEPRAIMGEIVSVIGGGFLFRQVARELVGLIPVVGIVPKVAVSYAGTWVIGRTVYLWATEGQTLSVADMRRFYDEALARGRALADTLIARLRRDAPALPAPDGTVPGHRRWWHRFRRARPALPAPSEGARVYEVPTPNPSLWQRVRRRLPGG